MGGATIYVNARAIIERETQNGTEILLQVATRPRIPSSLEFPGGRLNEFEPILAALAREVQEETGLTLTRILTDPARILWESATADVECLTPFFVYQTTRGPIDSVGFFFRCAAEGELTTAGNNAVGHRWILVSTAERMLAADPEQFDWLTQAALRFYLTWRRETQ